MRAVSLFSGIGGFDLGLERAGIETVLQVEIDEFCRRVLEKHWPDVRRIADVRDVTAEDCEGADLIFGGFPCQPASTAGSKKGVEDERWLWPEFARVVRVARPRYVLVENVPGLLSVNGGRAFSEVVGDLAALGYDAEWQCIPAAAFGAPHLRYRLFIVSHARCVRWDSARPDEPEREHEALRGREQPLGARTCGLTTDADSARQLQPQGRVFEQWRRPGDGGWWESEPDVERVVYGVPHAVDRIAALGNAVVPQVAQYVGERLVEFDRSQRSFEAHDLSDQQRGVPAKANNQSRLRGA